MSSPSQVKLDVVFVHGLGGSRSLTWTSENEEFWPAWLDDTVPNARIWDLRLQLRLLEDA